MRTDAVQEIADRPGVGMGSDDDKGEHRGKNQSGHVKLHLVEGHFEHRAGRGQSLAAAELAQR